MSVKSNMQKFGRAMLPPVAAMPLAGLIMRLSVGDMLNIPVIGAAGNTVFGNLDILFAIGVAVGFVKNKDKKIPALTDFLAIATPKKGLEVMDPEANVRIFGGIISDSVAAWTYNHFREQKLPVVFSYLAGEKLPLTMAMILQIIAVVLLGFIWPLIQIEIDNFVKLPVGMGALGVGVFMFLNHLLIPSGLHHVLNAYIYYDLGSYTSPSKEVFRGEMTRFINGDPQTGLFLLGLFVAMMFGIPATCLTIYRAAYKENKEMVKKTIGSGAGTSFIANITEPVEFSFVSLSPMLYVVHALFAGLAGIVCYLFNIRIGFTFGACIVNYLINSRIATNTILTLPVGIFSLALYYVTFYYLVSKRNVQTLGREARAELGNEVTLEEAGLRLASKNYEYMATKILQAFGGKANILGVYSCNTRLRVGVVDPTMVEGQRIRQLGIGGIIKPTRKSYQIIIGLEVTYVMAEFSKLLEE